MNFFIGGGHLWGSLCFQKRWQFKIRLWKICSKRKTRLLSERITWNWSKICWGVTNAKRFLYPISYFKPHRSRKRSHFYEYSPTHWISPDILFKNFGLHIKTYSAANQEDIFGKLILWKQKWIFNLQCILLWFAQR